MRLQVITQPNKKKTKTSCNLKTGFRQPSRESSPWIQPKLHPKVSKPASSPSHLLDPRKFNRLILECEQNKSKYEKTLAGALQQASLEKRLEGHSLVLCDQIIKTGRHFAGATLGDNNSGDPIKLSRAVKRIIMNI